MRRRYFGRIGANKVYRDPSTVNVNIDSDQGLELAAAVIKTCKTGKPIDTVFYFTRIQKRSGQIPQGKIPTNVSAILRPNPRR